jgi:hypothetical protein
LNAKGYDEFYTEQLLFDPSTETVDITAIAPPARANLD